MAAAEAQHCLDILEGRTNAVGDHFLQRFKKLQTIIKGFCDMLVAMGIKDPKDAYNAWCRDRTVPKIIKVKSLPNDLQSAFSDQMDKIRQQQRQVQEPDDNVSIAPRY